MFFDYQQPIMTNGFISLPDYPFSSPGVPLNQIKQGIVLCGSNSQTSQSFQGQAGENGGPCCH